MHFPHENSEKNVYSNFPSYLTQYYYIVCINILVCAKSVTARAISLRLLILIKPIFFQQHKILCVIFGRSASLH